MSEDLVVFIRARLSDADDVEWWHEQDCAGMPWGPYEPHCCAPRSRQVRVAEAIRAIVDLHELLGDPADYDYGAAPCLCEELWPCTTIKALAGIWRDHPDFDEAWKP